MTIISKIRSRFRREWFNGMHDLQSRFGVNENFFRNSRGSRIIIYHGICRQDPTRFNSIFMDLPRFEKHLQFYKKYFQVVSLEQYYKEKGDKARFVVSISFDDGYANNFKYVLPLLEKYEIPCTFFVTGIRGKGI